MCMFIIHIPDDCVTSDDSKTALNSLSQLTKTLSRSLGSHGRMEEFLGTTPFYSGPMYFFDQFKPKIRKWKKETQEDQFLYPKEKDDVEDLVQNLEHLSHQIEESTEPKEAQENIVALPEKEDKSHTLIISEPPSIPKFPLNSKFSKTSLYKTLFEEYKLIASEVLYELEKTLKRYAKNGMAFPGGLINLMTYSWLDLIEDFHENESPKKTLERDRDLGGGPSSMSIISFKECKVHPDAKEHPQEEHQLVKARKISHGAHNKLLEKPSLLGHPQVSQTTQESCISGVIHFSLKSKFCFQNGWIPCSKWEMLKFKADLSTAVKRLQVATVQIKMEEAKQKRGGFNKQPVLRHYNDPEEEEETAESTQEPRVFWMALLVGKAQMPAMGEAKPEMKKFHYALVDGSSLTYYPSGRLAICQSYSDLPWGGLYTNIFSDWPDPVVLGTFTPFGCGSISLPHRKVIAMMFNQDGGMLISKKGNIIREWMWPSKGKIEDPIEIGVNQYITVTISGRFAITLMYKRHPQSLKLSLAPVKHKPSCLPNKMFPDIHPSTRDAKEMLATYKMKCRLLKFMAQNKDASNLADPVDTDPDDPGPDISLLHDLVASIKLSKMQKKVKHILLHWLNYYRSTLGLESLHVCKLPMFAKKAVRKPKVAFAIPALSRNAKEADWYKEYLRYRNTFLALKEFFKPLPYHYIHRTSATNQCSRLPLLTGRKDLWFSSQLACPVVLRKTMCGEKGVVCRCSCHIIPEVTDLEYDNLISNQLSHVDQIIVVCVFSAKKEDKTIGEVTGVYREVNKSRHMPCVQSHLDSFRLLKYDVTSASKFTEPGRPLLVRRHNLTPGIFLMYIRGKLLFANFIFNGYSTSANDLQKQIVKTRKDYHKGYFLPSDFRIRNCTG
ncbi:uncharacterized protein C3orf20-like isoform X4 [Peromyscus maniculatus bairdii]|uniref:uncharacterized protein C3orf20-like isoform X4 n=1 Tax=Peromyscus maniculatus bairdii TaxID=230844 RepID=UPI001C2E69C0|nr:uncharacterized protein LOC107402647 isoform X4 [Peromyscus maniculatus bairdii]